MAHVSEKLFRKMWTLKPFVSTDSIVLKKGKIILIRRATSPFSGRWALPGGLMNTGETIEQAALREVLEETGYRAKIRGFVGVYSGPKRDPRGTTVSVSFLMDAAKKVRAHDHEIAEVAEFTMSKIPKNLAFDHSVMIKDALKITRQRKRR